MAVHLRGCRTATRSLAFAVPVCLLFLTYTDFPDFPREIAVNDLADGTVEQLLAVLGFIYTSELHAASSAPSTSSPDPDLLEMVQDKLQAEIDRLTHACRQEQERVRVLSDDNDRLHYEVGEARTDVALMRLEMDKLRHMKESTDDELKQSVEAERLAAAELARTQAALAAQLEHSQAASAEIMTLRRAEHDAKETAGSLRERVRELGSQLRAGEGRAAGREEGAPQTKAIAIGLQELRDGMRVVQANLSKSEKKHRVDTGLGRGAVSRGCSADAADSGVVRAGLGVMVVAMGMASVAVAVFA